MKYSALKPLLEGLEKNWFAQLQRSVPKLPPQVQAIANGYAQFFSVEEPPSPDQDVPLVVAVGINYDQGALAASFPRLTHWLRSRPPGTNWVVDNTWPQMRRALDAALVGYLSAPATWVKNGYASSAHLLPPHWHGLTQPQPQPYILAMTNISPFLSRKEWTVHSTHSPVQCRDLLKAWDPNHHICDLIGKVGAGVDLWVVHGIAEVWPRFSKPSSIGKWILTPNLSLRNLNTGSIRRFWKSGRTIRPALPQWPMCA